MNEELIDSFETIPEAELKFKPNSLIIWYIIVFIGLFLRLLHFPGFFIILLPGIAGTIAYSISRLISKKKINFYTISISVISIIWPIYVYSTLIRFRKHNPFSIYIIIGLTVLILAIYELIRRRNKKTVLFNPRLF